MIKNKLFLGLIILTGFLIVIGVIPAIAANNKQIVSKNKISNSQTSQGNSKPTPTNTPTPTPTDTPTPTPSPTIIPTPTPLKVEVDGSATASLGGTSLTWLHTVGEGNNKYLLVSAQDCSASVTSVTYAGQALTFLDSYTWTNWCTFYFYGLKNPPVGTYDVVVNKSAWSWVNAGSTSLFNVDQTNPTGNVAKLSSFIGFPYTLTASVPSSTSDVLVDITGTFNDFWANLTCCYAGQPLPYQPGVGQTILYVYPSQSPYSISTWKMGGSEATISETISSYASVAMAMMAIPIKFAAPI